MRVPKKTEAKSGEEHICPKPHPYGIIKYGTGKRRR